MAGVASRRALLSGIGAGAVGTVVGATAPTVAEAAAPSVRGTWLIEPKTSRGRAPFQALAAFAAGGVFITTGSDEAGTGLGEWSQAGASRFGFSYLNFHFGSAGKLANMVKVNAAGKFHGSRLTGRATLSTLDANGNRLSADARFTFAGKRVRVHTP